MLRSAEIKKSPGLTKLDQLTAELAKSHVQVIDLKQDFGLLPNVRLFHKTDSHWNQAGAFLGYLTIMNRIKIDFPGISILKLNDFIIDTTITKRQDISLMFHSNANESFIRLQPIHPGRAIKTENRLRVPPSYHGLVNNYEYRYSCVDSPLKTLVFRDSFTGGLIPFLSQSFGETVFVSGKINMDIIEQEKPDIVVIEVVERNIDAYIYMK